MMNLVWQTNFMASSLPWYNVRIFSSGVYMKEDDFHMKITDLNELHV